MQYREGQLVWLKAFDNGEEIQPRQKATVMGPETNGTVPMSLLAQVQPDDDMVREVPVDQIEGPALGPNDYKRTIWAQDASNLSGVLYDYAASMHKIRAEPNVGSGEAARHPISILMLDKLVSLAGGTVRWLEDDETYGKALKACQAEAASLETVSQSN